MSQPLDKLSEQIVSEDGVPYSVSGDKQCSYVSSINAATRHSMLTTLVPKSKECDCSRKVRQYIAALLAAGSGLCTPVQLSSDWIMTLVRHDMLNSIIKYTTLS